MKMRGPALNQAADRPVGTGTNPGRPPTLGHRAGSCRGRPAEAGEMAGRDLVRLLRQDRNAGTAMRARTNPEGRFPLLNDSHSNDKGGGGDGNRTRVQGFAGHTA
jgi:hypothetical protein